MSPLVMVIRMTFSLLEAHYIGAMNAAGTGPVATEMLRRLNSALSPTRIDLVDDSEQHRGHGGYNPAGESHFTLTIEPGTVVYLDSGVDLKVANGGVLMVEGAETNRISLWPAPTDPGRDS